MSVAVPDFGSLAQQQNAANNTATNLTNQANRPDQYNALGSNTWSQDGAGNWTQSSSLNGSAQNLFNTTLAGQQGLAGTVAGGINYGNLPAMPDSGFGATQSVIDAWNRLQQPGLDKDAAAQRARMAAQGITAGSVINNLGEKGISDAAGTARDKAILAGTTEYGNVFNRGMQARQQAANEAQTGYQAALQGLTGLGSVRDSLNPNKWNADVKTSAAYIPQTIYGAAQDTFNANMMNQNADLAQKNADRANTASLANTAVNAVGGLGGLWSGASNAWGWLTGGGDALNGWNSSPGWGNSFTGTNDFLGTTGNNAMNSFLTYGSSGD